MKSDRILNIILAIALLILIVKINKYDFLKSQDGVVGVAQVEGTADKAYDLKSGTHQTWVSLTVAESKRLIAKGLAIYPPVIECMKHGKLILAKGTTNTYVAEELIHDSLTNGEYVLGYISPAKSTKKVDRSKKRNEMVFVNGAIQDISYKEILPEMEEGDIVMKGANIINHSKGQAAIMIGHPTGGTIGNLYPIIQEKKLRYIIPVGLEKESSQDLNIIGEYSKIDHENIKRKTPWLWSVKGELFTEIEAIKQFADVEALHYGSGGIGGAEGAVSILIRGSETEVNKALNVIESIQGEPAFIK
ncbi:hypothetical protein [Ancylomarina sp. 16SWW S1-10-2]|uniref:hypothetical protein n=1 Tax=Ancylomarina sp. 16SWW S1-10-2 TaxID=2499681 RepID=UPI0012ADF9D2|nr:hypothetical protein [Ancylomarina sp. 16SWW S1-10-2]MRT93802.1 hypothetical protein [Ancylomarina sp. 16SWW S1-10-2]